MNFSFLHNFDPSMTEVITVNGKEYVSKTSYDVINAFVKSEIMKLIEIAGPKKTIATQNDEIAELKNANMAMQAFIKKKFPDAPF